MAAPQQLIVTASEVTNPVYAIALISGIAAMTIFILWWLARQDDKFEYTDLFKSLGRDKVMRADKVAFVYLGAFYFSSLWGSWMAWHHELSDTFLGLYMGSWAVALLGNNHIKAQAARNESEGNSITGRRSSVVGEAKEDDK